MNEPSDRDWELSKDSVKEYANQLYYKTLELEKRVAELEKDLAFYKCCMLSGEVAGTKDAPSYKAKGVNN